MMNLFMQHKLRFLVMIGIGLLAGCGTDDAAPKASHFEHDHDVADHWPVDLADVSKKLRERLAREDTGEQTGLEIKEIISWTAEIAADTNLDEIDWVPLYNASESLTANLRAAKGDLTDQNREQIESLCKLVDEASQKIIAGMPSIVKDQP